MIPKEVDWVTLSHCDAYAVKEHVESSNRIASSVIKPMRERVFYQKLKQNPSWKKTYDALCASYSDLEGNFSIVHDRFGGYRMLYTGKEIVNPPHVFRRTPVGFLKSIPDGVTDLSVMRSERTGGHLLLLGPIRFINSDCSPNCDYDFTSDLGIVQIRVKKKLRTGDEIYVKYGKEFFESNQCLCNTCDADKRLNEKSEIIFFQCFEALLEETVLEIFSEIACARGKRKRERISWKTKLQFYEGLCSQFSPPATESLRLTGTQDLSRIGESNIFFENVLPSEELSDTEIFSEELFSEEVNKCQPRSSSPMIDQTFVRPPSYSTINCNFENEPQCLEFSEEDPVQLYTGSLVSLSDARFLTELFCSRFSLSDVASLNLHSLISTFLPPDNVFPSGYSYIQKMKNDLETKKRFYQNEESRTFCVLNFRSQLNCVVERNINQLIEYGIYREQNNENDLKSEFANPFKIMNNSVCCNLILFTDGVNIKKSTLKKELWPIWVQIADLPPILRMARKNIVLAGLFVGSGIPDWNLIAPHLRAELTGSVHHSKLDLMISFKVCLLVADMGAKHHLLNMYKFNGFFGCHICTAEGKTIGRTHAYYSFEEPAEARTTNFHEDCVQIAESLKSTVRSVAGVKGKSAFSCLLDNLPITAPIDYMHCVLLGVFPDILKRVIKALSPTSKFEISNIVSNLACPRELIAYSRVIRQIDDIHQFKANEFLNWLLYISPIVFNGRIDYRLYKYLLYFVSAFRTLLETCRDDLVNTAEDLIFRFCENAVNFFEGDEKIETINMHSLKHLPSQVRNFGPLFTCSAMSFEAANRILGDVFTGSVNECDVICRRFLHKYSLLSVNLKNEKLMPLLDAIADGQKRDNEECFNKDMVEIEPLKLARDLYKDAVFVNRYKRGRTFFDSMAYRRSTKGNSFVQIMGSEEKTFGRILFFVNFTCESIPMCAALQLYKVDEEWGPIKGYFYRVKKTDVEDLKPVSELSKVFAINDMHKEEIFVITLSTAFEHS